MAYTYDPSAAQQGAQQVQCQPGPRREFQASQAA